MNEEVVSLLFEPGVFLVSHNALWLLPDSTYKNKTIYIYSFFFQKQLKSQGVLYTTVNEIIPLNFDRLNVITFSYRCGPHSEHQ